METVDPKELFNEGRALLNSGNPGPAMECFEKLIEQGHKQAAVYTWLGISMARSGWDVKEGEKLCKLAIQMDNTKPQYYLNLAEICTLKGNKEKAIEALKAGLKKDRRNRPILTELAKFGIRRRPPIPFMARENLVNKYLGKFLAKLHLR